LDDFADHGHLLLQIALPHVSDLVGRPLCEERRAAVSVDVYGRVASRDRDIHSLAQ